MKHLVFVFMLVILAGCSAERRLARLLERYPLPETSDSIHHDTVIYRDTLILERFVGDTVRDTILIPVGEDLPYMELKRASTLAEATAWLLDNQLGLELIQYDTLFHIPLDSVLVERFDTIIIETVKTVTVEKKMSSFWKHGFLALVGLFLVVMILWFTLKR